jgi:hypothetical protein
MVHSFGILERSLRTALVFCFILYVSQEPNIWTFILTDFFLQECVTIVLLVLSSRILMPHV